MLKRLTVYALTIASTFAIPVDSATAGMIPQQVCDPMINLDGYGGWVACDNRGPDKLELYSTHGPIWLDVYCDKRVTPNTLTSFSGEGAGTERQARALAATWCNVRHRVVEYH